MGAGVPTNLVYFLETTTDNIDGASRNPVRWTFLALCGANNNENANCRSTQAALPFDPQANFGTDQGIPDGFVGNNKFFYLSRCMFAFYLIALFFAVVSLFVGVLALCTRLGNYLGGLTVFFALFFQTLTAALMTCVSPLSDRRNQSPQNRKGASSLTSPLPPSAWTVEGRNIFNNAGESATLGQYAYGFTWAAMACFLVCTVLFCVGGRAQKDNNNSSSYPKKSYFGRKKSTRSNKSRPASFFDGESTRRVKDDYD